VTSVGTYMTKAPHTVGVEQSLTVARRLMNEHHVRHLPVLHGGELVGILSDREIKAFEVLPGSRDLTVEDAMVTEVLAISESSPLERVADEMVRRQVDSAVVVAGAEGTKVLGVFTAVDALRALSDALRAADSVARREADELRSP
jgi:acetoin utilization protein AcuB